MPATAAQSERRYLPLQEAAKRYGVSERTMFRLLERGVVKRHRFPGGNTVYVDPQEMDAVLAASART